MKIELQRLMKVETEAKQKEAMLVTAESQELPSYVSLSNGDPSTTIGHVEKDRIETPEQATQASLPVLMNNFALPPRRAPTPDLENTRDLESTSTVVAKPEANVEDALLARLNECASAMEKLSATLNDTIIQWEQSGKYQRESLRPDFQLLNAAIKRVSALELMDTRTSTRKQMEEPCAHAVRLHPVLTTHTRNKVQMSRSQHFSYEPVSLPSSRAVSPVSPY